MSRSISAASGPDDFGDPVRRSHPADRFRPARRTRRPRYQRWSRSRRSTLACRQHRRFPRGGGRAKLAELGIVDRVRRHAERDARRFALRRRSACGAPMMRMRHVASGARSSRRSACSTSSAPAFSARPARRISSGAASILPRPASRAGPRRVIPAACPDLPDAVTCEAYSHEESSVGFWPGSDAYPHAAFYAYAYPAPPAMARPRSSRPRPSTAPRWASSSCPMTQSAPRPIPMRRCSPSAGRPMMPPQISARWDRDALECPARPAKGAARRSKIPALLHRSAV